MENFDVEKSLNPTLVRGALISYEESLFQVEDMDKEKIYISNNEASRIAINDNEWNPVELDEEWLKKFGFEVGRKIYNINTGQDWIIKTTGKYLYITAIVPPPYRDSPLVGLYFVHELQAWFFRLTKQDLIYHGFDKKA